eukprot:8359569-Pyramimonas_sp.AAC.1
MYILHADFSDSSYRPGAPGPGHVVRAMLRAGVPLQAPRGSARVSGVPLRVPYGRLGLRG